MNFWHWIDDDMTFWALNNAFCSGMGLLLTHGEDCIRLDDADACRGLWKCEHYIVHLELHTRTNCARSLQPGEVRNQT